jgi:hypothetical protein
MAVCEHCGNEYDKSFQVIMSGKTHTFDSFECAIHALAPSCAHCGVKIMGHVLEKAGTFLLLRPLRRSERSAGFARSDLVGHRAVRIFEGTS